MSQIKDLAITKTSPNDSDYLVLQDPTTGQTYKITKANLFLNSISGSNSWTPSQINTALWLDASDSSTVIKTGTAVSQWMDKSLYGRDLFQSVSASQPVITSQLNNKNVITFDGTNDYLRVSYTNDYGSNVSLFFVAKYNTTRIALFDGAPGLTNVLRNAASNQFEWHNNAPFLAIDCAINDYEILNFNYQMTSTRNISKYVNGGGFASTTASSSTPATWGTFTLGAINTTTSLLAGSIAEVIMVASTVSTAVRQKIEGYLAWKWGLVTKLSNTHPYKNSSPTII